ncbi:MAG: HAD family phosphatase [Bdellovibrionota bacterium]
MTSIKSFQHALLDFDGTLVNTIPSLYKAYQEFTDIMHINASKNEFDRLNGPSILEACQYFKDTYAIKTSVENIFATYQKCIQKHYQGSDFFDNADQLLELMQQNDIRIHLVTSNNQENVQPLLQKFHWAHFFSSQTFGTEVTTSKPNPAIYQHVLHKDRSINANNSFVLEDSIHGVTAAHQAGLQVYAIAEKNIHLRLQDKGAIKTFVTIDEVIKSLLS